MAKRDYYEVLGVSKTASKDEIKSSYRKLAKQYHPDNKETGDEAKFKEVQEAYDILYDDQKRAAYDQFGHAAFDQSQGGGPGGPFGGGFSGFSGFGDGVDIDLGDIFGSFFGGGSSRRKANNGPRKGDDSLMRLRVEFMDVVKGKDQNISFEHNEPCPNCKGTGAETPSDIKVCPTCHGTGTVRRQQRGLFGGVMEVQEACPECRGTGKTITKKCHECGGQKYKRIRKDIQIHIPAGINNGQQIRVAGMGEPGINGGEFGDLYIEINVKPHNIFRREGNDIHIDVPVDFIDCALGRKIEVPTVNGMEKIEIPNGTQFGTVLKMKGKGINDLRTKKPGDQYVHLQIKIPTSLNRKQKAALEDYLKASDNDTYEKYKKGVKI